MIINLVMDYQQINNYPYANINLINDYRQITDY